MNQLQQIIQGCLKKDTRAEYALYKECFAVIMRICRRYARQEDDAVDLLNRAFLKVLNNLESYQPDKPFDKWVKAITVNTVIDEFRKNKNYRSMMAESELSDLPDSYIPVDINLAEEMLSAAEVLKEINRLPEGSREVFNLHIFEGLSHSEIAERLEITESTSRWHVANARNKLKARFGKLLNALKIVV